MNTWGSITRCWRKQDNRLPSDKYTGKTILVVFPGITIVGSQFQIGISPRIFYKFETPNGTRRVILMKIPVSKFSWHHPFKRSVQCWYRTPSSKVSVILQGKNVIQSCFPAMKFCRLSCQMRSDRLQTRCSLCTFLNPRWNIPVQWWRPFLGRLLFFIAMCFFCLYSWALFVLHYRGDVLSSEGSRNSK